MDIYILLYFIMILYISFTYKNAPIVKDYKENVFNFFTNLNLFYFGSLFLMIAINFIIIRNTNKESNTNKLLRSLPIMTKSIIGSVFIEPILFFLIFILVGLGINTIFSLCYRNTYKNKFRNFNYNIYYVLYLCFNNAWFSISLS